MQVIAVLSQKGGAGKTTVSIGLAVESERAGRPALILDIDPQGSASRWADLREAAAAGPVTPVVTATQATQLRRLIAKAAAAAAELVIIDTAPSATSATLNAARAADLILIPCRAFVPDLLAISDTVDTATISQTPTCGIINAAPVNNPVTPQALEAVSSYGIETAPVVLHNRVDHSHAFAVGKSASEYAPAGKAAAEMRALYEWIHARA